MSEKSKSIFGKLIDTADKTHACIYIDFSSGEDAQINVIQKNENTAKINDDNNKALTLLLSDIQSQFKQQGISLNRVQGQPEGKRKLTAGLKTDKASLSETEVALQKMQFRAQELGVELVLTDRPAEMANERWRLPGASGQENRSESMTAAEGLAKLAAVIKTVTDKCPLQITLMIQPDLRPQVMMKVSASGGVNWIFAAKEGRYPLKDLLAKMAGKTTTHGWDAIVVYQRGQANMLLKQQHIKRFITSNVLAPLNEDIESSDATRLQTHNLTLSAPHLSFDGAGSGDSVAQVGWDFVKGMIVFTQEADDGSYRVKKIEKITPLNSPFIAMKVPLSRSPGSVSKIGEVQFDIKEGDHFTNNLVINDIEQDTISGFFKRRFEATQAEQRIYKLGTISNYENQQLQPEKFDIRTMGAPNTESRGSQDEGDGAVVLFAQMKGSDSRPVEKETDWLLADNYTSALVLGNKCFLDNISYPDALIRYKKYQMGDNVNSLWGAISKNDGSGIGNIAQILVDYKNERPFPGIEDLTKYTIHGIYNFYLSDDPDVVTPYIIYPDYVPGGDKQFVNTYHTQIAASASMNITSYDANNKEFTDEYMISFYVEIKLNLNYRADVIREGYTHLVTMDRDIEDNDVKIGIIFRGCDPQHDTHLDLEKATEFSKDILKNELEEKIRDGIHPFIIKKGLGYIDTFFVRNLLFPEENYFRPEFAFVPGDLLIQGQLAPGSESFAVSSTETTIVAGSEYQFTTNPEVSGIKWSISDSEKGSTNADLGHIDAKTGKYTAPQARAITEGVRHVVVCAEKWDTKVYALVSVLAHSVNISPAYQVILPGKSSALTAESLNSGELTWTL
ncbi:hypothetical protein, partial [Morganella psychrotolerans]